MIESASIPQGFNPPQTCLEKKCFDVMNWILAHQGCVRLGHEISADQIDQHLDEVEDAFEDIEEYVDDSNINNPYYVKLVGMLVTFNYL